MRPTASWRYPSREAGTSAGHHISYQVAPDDCTGCGLCVEICPIRDKQDPKRKALNMVPVGRVRATEQANWDFFLGLPEFDRSSKLKGDHAQGRDDHAAAVRVLRRLRRLRRDALHQARHPAVRRPHADRQRHRLLVDLRRQPADHAYTTNPEGRGPAWNNSLFEDNAEFGLGMRSRSTSRPSTPRTAGGDAGGRDRR